MKHIYVCTSKIEGHGINIGENVKKGEVIARIQGELKFKINKSKKDALSNPNWVGIKKDHWIDPDKPYKFLNHSCNPNAGIKGTRDLIALRDLKEGDEVTIDYSIIEGDPRWEMQCHCGSKNCRKIIRSIHSLPKSQFRKYFPFIASHFKKLYFKEHGGEERVLAK